MGHIDHCRIQALVELGNLGPHLDTHFRIKVGEGLIKQKPTGLAHDGPTDRHTLALSAREGFWLALEIIGNAENPGGLVDSPPDFLFRELPQFEAEGHVLIDRHVRIERIVLENYRLFPGDKF